jgi:hypothetical protein
MARGRCVALRLALAGLLAVAGCRVKQPTFGELEGTWRLEQSPGGAGVGVLELVRDGTCRPDAPFIAFLAACNAGEVPRSPESCHWGAGSEPDEVSLVVATEAGFLALRMAAWRPLPGAQANRLNGRCVGKNEYSLSR